MYLYILLFDIRYLPRVFYSVCCVHGFWEGSRECRVSPLAVGLGSHPRPPAPGVAVGQSGWRSGRSGSIGHSGWAAAYSKQCLIILLHEPIETSTRARSAASLGLARLAGSAAWCATCSAPLCSAQQRPALALQPAPQLAGGARSGRADEGTARRTGPCPSTDKPSCLGGCLRPMCSRLCCVSSGPRLRRPAQAMRA